MNGYMEKKVIEAAELNAALNEGCRKGAFAGRGVRNTALKIFPEKIKYFYNTLLFLFVI